MQFSRVTNSMMTNLFLRDIRRNLSTLTDLQHQISTGKRVTFPSDDPIAADRILDYRQNLDKIAQYSDNIDQSKSLANNIDGALGTMEDVLLSARDISVRAANEAPNDEQALKAYADEIDNLVSELYSQSNQRYDGKYLFSGFKTDTQSFTISNELEFVATPGAATSTLSMPTYTIDGVTRSSQAITEPDSVKDILIYDNATDTWTSVYAPPYNAIGIASDAVTNIVQVAGAGNIFNDGTRVRLVFDKNVSVKYNGDMGERSAEIGEGTQIGTSFIGAASKDSAQRNIFGSYSDNKTETGTAEAFQYLFDLRDSIYKYKTANDQFQADPNPDRLAVKIATIDVVMGNIHKGTSDIDKIRQNVTDVRAEQGGRVNRLDLALNRLANMKLDTKALLSKNEDVDMTEALSQLVLNQNIYQAALGVGAKIIQTTLLDFLR